MKKLLFLTFLLACTQLSAQGLLYSEESYMKVKPYDSDELGFASNPPKAFSMKEYTPIPLEQYGGTCVSVSCGYSALSTAYNYKFNRKGVQAHLHSFQPYYLYSYLSSDTSCMNGTYIEWAMEFLKDYGCFKYWTPFDIYCDQEYEEDFGKACHYLSYSYRIKDFYRIELENYESVSSKAYQLKGVLAEGRPIPIGMNLPAPINSDNPFSSFDTLLQTDLWRPSKMEIPDTLGGHAMVVIGYDDNKFGGAFQIMNSWGTEWGDGGYFWVRYDDFFRFTKMAFAISIYEDLNTCLNEECNFQYGRYELEDGSIYEGQIFSEQLSGFGIEEGEDYIYLGFYNSGSWDGKGALYTNDSLFMTEYENGKLRSFQSMGFAGDDNSFDEEFTALIETLTVNGAIPIGNTAQLDQAKFGLIKPRDSFQEIIIEEEE